MNLAEFQATLSAGQPTSELPIYLHALWWDAKGHWEKGHGLIQDLPDETAAWIHAYFHRKEGDIWNADYWYQRAGKKRPSVSLQEEWETISETLLP